MLAAAAGSGDHAIIEILLRPPAMLSVRMRTMIAPPPMRATFESAIGGSGSRVVRDVSDGITLTAKSSYSYRYLCAFYIFCE
jgi:hypothetical protein